MSLLSEEEKAEFAGMTALGRWGNPEEMMGAGTNARLRCWELHFRDGAVGRWGGIRQSALGDFLPNLNQVAPPMGDHEYPRPAKVGDSQVPASLQILVLQPKRIGDLILTAPAIDVLRHEYPGSHITLVSAGAAGGNCWAFGG